MNELLPLPILARYLRVSQSWLRKEAQSGRLPAVDAGGGRYLFSRVAVERVLLDRAQQTEATSCK